MTNHQRTLLNALARCRFLPGSWDKRFVRDVSSKPDDYVLSGNQDLALDDLAKRYRSQLQVVMGWPAWSAAENEMYPKELIYSEAPKSGASQEVCLRHMLALSFIAKDFGEFDFQRLILADCLEEQGFVHEAELTRASWITSIRRELLVSFEEPDPLFRDLATQLLGCTNRRPILCFKPRAMVLVTRDEKNRLVFQVQKREPVRDRLFDTDVHPDGFGAFISRTITPARQATV